MLSQSVILTQKAVLLYSMLCNSGYSLLSRDQNSNTVTSLKASIRFLSAVMSISCFSSLSGRSRSSIETQNGFWSQLISSSGDGKCFLIDVYRFMRCSITFLSNF